MDKLILNKNHLAPADRKLAQVAEDAMNQLAALLEQRELRLLTRPEWAEIQELNQKVLAFYTRALDGGLLPPEERELALEILTRSTRMAGHLAQLLVVLDEPEIS